MSISPLPDEPTTEAWDQWLDEHCKIDGIAEENLLRTAEPEGECASCQWWRSYNLDKDLLVLENGDVYIEGKLSGECWRFPPTGEPPEGDEVARYPTTTSNMTCGEWKARAGEGKRTRLTETIHISVATGRRRNGETVRTYRHGSVLHTQQQL